MWGKALKILLLVEEPHTIIQLLISIGRISFLQGHGHCWVAHALLVSPIYVNIWAILIGLVYKAAEEAVNLRGDIGET